LLLSATLPVEAIRSRDLTSWRLVGKFHIAVAELHISAEINTPPYFSLLELTSIIA